MLHSINQELGLYVLSAGKKGFTCLSFEVAFEWAFGVAKWLREHQEACETPESEKRGTTEGFEQYHRIMDAGCCFNRRTGKRCGVQLTPQLNGLEGCRVEVIDRVGDKRRFWVGRSTGWMPVHLEIARTNSSGGHAVFGTPFQSIRVVHC